MDALLRVLSRAMDHSVRRQRYLAGNIANQETPGYARKDVAGPEFGDIVGGFLRRDVVTTHPAHQNGRTESPGASGRVFEAGRVELEKEVARLSANSVYFSVLARLASLRGQMISQVVRGG